jgi:hypothetical protein
MGKVSLFCVILVFALLLEDGSSVKKKTEDERKEDEEIAEKVNATLAEEAEKKKKEEDEAKRKKKVKTPGEEKDEDEKKKKQEKDEDRNEKEDSQDEACLPANITCPAVKPCPPCKDCEACKDCPTPVGCQPCKECDSCIQCEECPPLECPAFNQTGQDVECPAPPTCPGNPGMSLPAAMAVGAVTGILVTGMAAVVGLILRYVSPIVSGFLFLATIIIVWYLCSHYPEAARDLGGRAATLLREAAVALGHRVMAALQRHEEQVGFPV